MTTQVLTRSYLSRELLTWTLTSTDGSTITVGTVEVAVTAEDADPPTTWTTVTAS